MTKIKKTYVNSHNKKLVREFILQKITFEKVIGLPGPDINVYLERFEKKGVKDFEIYEIDSKLALVQLAKVKSKSKLSLKIGDIINASPDEKNVFYDLDFCDSVKYLQEHISKFKNNFMMTFSYRIGLKYTIDTFFKARNEKIIKKKELANPIKHTIFTTNNGDYIFIKYFDTSAMCCFAKI